MTRTAKEFIRALGVTSSKMKIKTLLDVATYIFFGQWLSKQLDTIARRMMVIWRALLVALVKRTQLRWRIDLSFFRNAEGATYSSQAAVTECTEALEGAHARMALSQTNPPPLPLLLDDTTRRLWRTINRFTTTIVLGLIAVTAMLKPQMQAEASDMPLAQEVIKYTTIIQCCAHIWATFPAPPAPTQDLGGRGPQPSFTPL